MEASQGRQHEASLWTATKPLHYDKERVSKLRFIICGTARSGTGYTAKVFEKLGIPCGHEEIFGYQYTKSERQLIGESSWLALPSLPELPEDIVLLHQTRHPLKVIRSNIRKGLLLVDPKIKQVRNVYGRFALRNLGLPKHSAGFHAYLLYWIQWNLMLEGMAETRPYFRYRVEDLHGDNLALWEKIIYEVIGLKGSYDIEKAIKEVDADYNTTDRRQKIAEKMPALPNTEDLQALDKLAQSYSYSLY